MRKLIVFTTSGSKAVLGRYDNVDVVRKELEQRFSLLIRKEEDDDNIHFFYLDNTFYVVAILV